ncbi:50S ribosomal protein L9 [Candidatus Nomurabacteria bacterium]|nr:50S ribosomal protein L9 [Candidatus Nomurabacteria bacterium]
MKVLFLQSVAKVANKGEIKDVNQGYATNFLLPRKLAKVISGKEEEQIKKSDTQQREISKINHDLFEKEIHSLKGKELIIKEKANEQGHLFSKVHKDEIQKALKEQLHVEINQTLINVDEPIKSVGTFDVIIGDKKVNVSIKVMVESV